MSGITGERSLKRRLADGEQLLGALVRMPAEDVVEMLGTAGLDYLVIDCEHGPADVGALRRHLVAAQLYGMPVLVRVGEAEPQLVLRALDQGAAGIIVPHVDDAAQAEAAVRRVHYPPRGERGFATYARAGGFGTVPGAEHLRRTAAETLLIAMVESAAGCRHAGEILAVDGVDGLLLGPADLAVSLGAAGDAGAPEVREAMREVQTETARSGGLRMDIVSSPDAARASLADGAGLVVYNLTHVLMATFTGLTLRP